ncbi:MAG: 3-isopropylmalate dehydrogenase [Phycisphaerales bacterium]|nr:3-isopropylmalate dehydrogenase [Hyphomonadaceae bacterium]
MKSYAITLLPGDGVGPEVTYVAKEVLHAVAERFNRRFVFDTQAIGGAAIEASGAPLTQETLVSCRQADAVFLGAVGGPKWERSAQRPEAGLLELRKALGLFANIRPVRVYDELIDCSPLRRTIVAETDLVIFRELTGGSYFGEKRRTADRASDECVYTVGEIERIAHAAFTAARARRGKVTSVDKANVLETSRLWRETVTRLHAESYADVKLEHALVDSMAMQLIRQPRAFDVIVTENMFGDILSDEASVLGGSIGLAPSASLGAGQPGLFEPVHGSAPDIAGRDLCNPIGAVLSVALLLRYGLKLREEADAVDSAVERALRAGARTADLGGDIGCRAMGDLIVDQVLRSDAFTHCAHAHWG